jgi:hypothetical protein
MKEISTSARNLGVILTAFGEIKGPRNIMVGYTIGQILKPVRELQALFVDRIGEYVDAGGNLKTDLSDEDKEYVQGLVNEEVSFEVPRLTIKMLSQSNLSVTDDTVLTFLVDVGVLEG